MLLKSIKEIWYSVHKSYHSFKTWTSSNRKNKTSVRRKRKRKPKAERLIRNKNGAVKKVKENEMKINWYLKSKNKKAWTA